MHKINDRAYHARLLPCCVHQNFMEHDKLLLKPNKAQKVQSMCHDSILLYVSFKVNPHNEGEH